MPTFRTLISAGTAALALAALSQRALAQSAQKWSVQASGLFVGLFGTAYDGIKDGPGFEAQVRVTPSAWSFGGGIQYSSHSPKEADFDLGDTKLTLAGAFFEPRRVIDVGSSTAAPYLSARLAILQMSLDYGGVSGSTTGTQLNVGGGVLFRLTPKLNLDLGATFGLIKFGDLKVEGYGESTTLDYSEAGQNLVLRVGFAYGLGK